MSDTPDRFVKLYVDLTGSNCGPEFLNVDMDLRPPADWTAMKIRQGAAEHYAVPLDQVGEPREIAFCAACKHPDDDCICEYLGEIESGELEVPW